MRKDTVNWIALAEYDLETAQHMLTTGRFLYIARDYLKQATEVLKWLKHHPNLSE
jgi:hypothetical protein